MVLFSTYLKQQQTNNRRYTQKTCDSLQTWSSKDAAVYAFAMRPIVNPKEYYNNIRTYLTNIMLNDIPYIQLFSNDKYIIINEDDSYDLKQKLLSKLNVIMSNSCENISMFKNYNPLNESFVINDVNIVTYKSLNNPNKYFQSFTFSASNTTRYNTISFKGSAYQDSNNIYINTLDFSNNIECVIGNEELCKLKPKDTYSNDYEDTGDILPGYSVNMSNYKGPENFETLIKDLSVYYNS
jgi:hypothetical protein